MTDKKLPLRLLVLAMVFTISACQNGAAENEKILPSSVILPTQTLSPTPKPNLDSLIRKIDFGNFKYHWVYMNISRLGFFELVKGNQEKT